MKIDHRLLRQGFAGIGKTFRGDIPANCKRFKLIGKAYEAMPREQDGHFMIESARHLAGPLRALLDPLVRFIFLIGATQVMKSIIGDIWVPFVLEHVRRNMLVLFEDDPKAKLFCDVRLMDTIKQHPVLKHQIQSVDRHDATKTMIKLPGVLLKVGGLNDGNCSSLSWGIMWISEAWQHGSDGLLGKAIRRADRFPNDCKILVESQAGRAGEDLHKAADGAHEATLTWACPFCGGRQSWETPDEFATLRPEGFQPLPPDPAALARWGLGVLKAAPGPGSFAGMVWDKGENLGIEERARSARWECYHCGVRIPDEAGLRQAIMDSYEQDYRVTLPDGSKLSPRAVCFRLPKEAARDNRFEDAVKNYLTAKEAERAGNLVPIENWYMSERAVFYSPKLTQRRAAVIIGSHDVTGLIPDEAARLMMVDCQQDPEASALTGKSIVGHFWYVAWAIDKAARNIYQLARGYARSWDEWIAVRKLLKIPNRNTAVDGGNWLEEIIDRAAMYWEAGLVPDRKGRMIQSATVWTIMRGNGTRRSFYHDEDKKYRVFAKPSFHTRTVKISGHDVRLDIPVLEWSALSVKDQLFAIRQGGEGKPKLHILPRHKLDEVTQQKEQGELTYERQVTNEYRTRKNNRDIWVESNPNVHYNDDDCMGIVQCARGGWLGHIAAPEERVSDVG